jgi:hypothetical protein
MFVHSAIRPFPGLSIQDTSATTSATLVHWHKRWLVVGTTNLEASKMGIKHYQIDRPPSSRQKIEAGLPGADL